MKKRLIKSLYNADRAVASLFGAPCQEIISSEIGRRESNPIDEEAADILDATQKNHVEKAFVSNGEDRATVLLLASRSRERRWGGIERPPGAKP